MMISSQSGFSARARCGNKSRCHSSPQLSGRKYQDRFWGGNKRKLNCSYCSLIDRNFGSNLNVNHNFEQCGKKDLSVSVAEPFMTLITQKEEQILQMKVQIVLIMIIVLYLLYRLILLIHNLEMWQRGSTFHRVYWM